MKDAVIGAMVFGSDSDTSAAAAREEAVDRVGPLLEMYRLRSGECYQTGAGVSPRCWKGLGTHS